MRHANLHIDTTRLRLRPLDARSSADARFILELLNQASFIQNIADRGVRNLADATRYLLEGPETSYRVHGFGLLRTALRERDQPIGLCGLLQRDYLEHPDLGYALLDQHAGQGYALEAARAVMEWAWRQRSLPRVLATTKPHNDRSIRLLERLGFGEIESRCLPGNDTPSRMFAAVAPS